MSELTPEAVALLEAARQGHGPSDNDRKRVLATLHASLGIGVPIALAPAAAEALASGQGAAHAASSAAHAGSSALQAAGSALQQSAAHGAGASAVAAGHTAKGALSVAGKLLTWKAGKLLLASVALSSAVGIGVSVAPRRAPDEQARLAGKSGQAAAFATDLRSQAEEPRAATNADAGKSSSPSPLPTPSPAREPTVVAAAPGLARGPDAPSALEPAELAPAQPRSRAEEPRASSEPGHVARATPHARTKHGSARSQRRSTAAQARAQARVSTPVASAAVAAPPSADKPADVAPPAQPIAALPLPSAPAQPEALNELALIRRAMTSLRDRDANGALALLEEHATRFPSGSFATERRGLHVVALCAAGRLDDGRREQAAFLKFAGSSPIAARVRGACHERDD